MTTKSKLDKFTHHYLKINYHHSLQNEQIQCIVDVDYPRVALSKCWKTDYSPTCLLESLDLLLLTLFEWSGFQLEKRVCILINVFVIEGKRPFQRTLTKEFHSQGKGLSQKKRILIFRFSVLPVQIPDEPYSIPFVILCCQLCLWSVEIKENLVFLIPFFVHNIFFTFYYMLKAVEVFLTLCSMLLCFQCLRFFCLNTQGEFFNFLLILLYLFYLKVGRFVCSFYARDHQLEIDRKNFCQNTCFLCIHSTTRMHNKVK